MKRILSICISALIGVACFAQSNNFEISKNMEIFSSVYKTLFENYVEDLNTGELMRTGIDAMLESLDPYTEYKSESETEDFRFMATGQYGGIGALIVQRDNCVAISQPYKGFPADKAGLKTADEIISIEGKDVTDLKSNEVSELMKGEPGTTLGITIRRYGNNNPLNFAITREKVSLPCISHYDIFNDSIGYIMLNSFTASASKDFLAAYNELSKKHKLGGLIIDLRSNGGGLLDEAVKIMNFFVPSGETIVSTRGRIASKNVTHKTRTSPIDTNIPIVVLINGASASASEILAGAMQDLDRGVIVGQRTFGKGLVQNIVPTAYNSQMKVTVAKYYIPSGRCIQAIDYSHKDASGNWEKVPDSLMTQYFTKKKRPVMDGAGIQPDIEVGIEDAGEVSANLYAKFLIFDFATRYYYENITDSAKIDPSTFEITEETWNDFINYLHDRDFSYTTTAERQFEKLKTYLKENNYYESMTSEINDFAASLNAAKDNDLITYKEYIKIFLGAEIISRFCYEDGNIIYSLRHDNDLDKAMEILSKRSDYDKILSKP
ncbi:MAG: S41 family peptidase [Bacteroidales bacterium]|nr:S41 family peptidase [Bacteroidales bacterium]